MPTRSKIIYTFTDEAPALAIAYRRGVHRLG